MRQLITPNLNIPYVGGLCEGYVEGTCGQATLPTRNHQMTYGVYGNAVSPVNRGETAKWDANPGNGNRPNQQPPKGVIVPIYFTLGSTPAGHTALSLGDGRVISSSLPGYNDRGYIHNSIQDLINFYAPSNGGCKYIGWSTHVGRLKIVEEDDMIIEDNKYWRARCDRSFQMIRNVEMNDEQFKQWVGKEFLYFIEALQDDKSAEIALNWQRTGKIAVENSWESKLKENILTIKSLNEKNKELQAELAKCGSNLNGDTELAVDTNKKVNIILELLQNLITKITSIFK